MSDAAAQMEFDILNRLGKLVIETDTYDVRDDTVRINVGTLKEAGREIERLREMIKEMSYD